MIHHFTSQLNNESDAQSNLIMAFYECRFKLLRYSKQAYTGSLKIHTRERITNDFYHFLLRQCKVLKQGVWDYHTMKCRPTTFWQANILCIPHLLLSIKIFAGMNFYRRAIQNLRFDVFFPFVRKLGQTRYALTS